MGYNPQTLELLQEYYIYGITIPQTLLFLLLVCHFVGGYDFHIVEVHLVSYSSLCMKTLNC